MRNPNHKPAPPRKPEPRLTRRLRLPASALTLAACVVACQPKAPTDLALEWTDLPNRPWAGGHIWANRLQDWEVRDGRLVSTNPLPMRTAHILTRRGAPEDGSFRVTLTTGFSRAQGQGEERAHSEELIMSSGVLVGVGGPDLDYRRSALVHHSPGPGGGIYFAVDQEGHLLVKDFSDQNRELARSPEALPSTEKVELELRVSKTTEASPDDGEDLGSGVVLEARVPGDRGAALTLTVPALSPARLSGGLALVADASPRAPADAPGGSMPGNLPGNGPAVWFSSMVLTGAGVEAHPERRLGSILGAQHTMSRGTLSLSAQLFPISPMTPGPGVPTTDLVLLELQNQGGDWVRSDSAPVVVPGYTTIFRMEDWDSSRDVPYRLSLLGSGAQEGEPPFQGYIRAEPKGEDFVVAAFTGNHNAASPGVDRGSFDWASNVWFPHQDMVAHVQTHHPDFLFFSGDQVYEGASPTQADFQHPYADYLYKWYLWFWAFRDLTAEIPAVTVPDDHDVFHGNVWGAGGRNTPPGLVGAEAQDQGGYRLSADWVNMVQRTQAGHLPDPWDPTPSPDGIENYFTDVVYGGVSFAVLEDRKFKSPPKLLLPEADVWNGWAQNPAFDARTQADPPGASLLGASQEEFLGTWAEDWTRGTWMKVVLSQTIFANVATIPADAMNGSVIPSLPIPEPGAYIDGDKMAADMDSNGWPPSGRDRALRAMRKGFAVHLAGDQHLASTIQYGVDEFGDGPFALCVPSVANFWPRRWYPPVPEAGRAPGAPAYAGDFLDGFGNPMTVFAVSNPARWGHEPAVLHNRAPGYGIARLGHTTREVSLEAWPRWADPDQGGVPYLGWPVVFRQEEGFGAVPEGYLPSVEIQGSENPVIQVIDEGTGEVVYTLRIAGTRFTPPVFGNGPYTLRVGEPDQNSWEVFLGLQPSADSSRVLPVQISAPDQRE